MNAEPNYDMTQQKHAENMSDSCIALKTELTNILIKINKKMYICEA